MSDNPKHVTVRLRVPPELRDRIAESAETYNRSMNADMVARLQKSFDDLDKEVSELQIGLALMSIEKKLTELKNIVHQIENSKKQKTHE